MTYDKYVCSNDIWCNKIYEFEEGTHERTPVCPHCGSPTRYELTYEKDDNDNIINERIDQSKINVNKNVDFSQFEDKKPKCPTCGSTNIERIGVLDRAVSIGILGIFSNKINKSYKCRNCKATW